MLGDVTYDDSTYAGESSDNPAAVGFYRDKVLQFQAMMNGVDAALMSAYATQALFPDDEELAGLISEAEGKLGMIQATAAGINLAADGLNAIGVRFPVLSTGGLAGVPLLAIAGAVGAAYVLAQWGVAWINRLYDKQIALAQSEQARADALAMSDPTARDQALAAAAAAASQAAQTASAASQASGSPLSQIGSIIKYCVIGAGLYFAYRAIENSRGN